MPTCNTSVTTPTGVFTYFDKEVTACEAKFECAKRGQILAPITNWDDLDALKSIAQIEHPSCKFHWGFKTYHVGLDINICGNKQYRLFTNNVVWNKTEHRKLYRWVGNKTEDVNIAAYSPYFKKLYIYDSDNKASKQRFICLKPNGTSTCSNAQPLIKNDVVFNSNSNILVIYGALVVALVGILFMLNLKRRKSFRNYEVMKLTIEAGYYKEKYEELLNQLSLIK